MVKVRLLGRPMLMSRRCRSRWRTAKGLDRVRHLVLSIWILPFDFPFIGDKGPDSLLSSLGPHHLYIVFTVAIANLGIGLPNSNTPYSPSRLSFVFLVAGSTRPFRIPLYQESVNLFTKVSVDEVIDEWSKESTLLMFEGKLQPLE